MVTEAEWQAQLTHALEHDRTDLGTVIYDIARAGFHKGEMLNELDLSKADLWLEFLGADLAGSNFTESYLYEANLDGANLYRTVFIQADLRGASLWNVNLEGAVLDHCLAGGAAMIGNLKDASFMKANLQGAFLGDHLVNAQFVGANLTDTQFIQADLRGANFSGAILKGASFKDCSFDSTTILPDGSVWQALDDLGKFITPDETGT